MKTPLLILFCSVIILLVLWDSVWKLIALWKSARNNQLAWFVCLAIFNTLARICHITDDFSRRRESTDLKAALAVPFF